MPNGYHRVRHKEADARLTGRKVALPEGLAGNCLYWQQAGYGDLEKMRRNFGTGKLETLIGNPLAKATHAEFDATTNHVATTIMEPIDHTTLLFVKNIDTAADNAHRGVFSGNYQGAVDPGCMIYVPDPTHLRAQVEQSVNQQQQAILTVDVNKWKRYSIVVSSTGGANNVGKLVIYNETDGTSTTEDFETARSPGEKPMLFGSSYSNIFKGKVASNHTSFWRIAMTPTQRLAAWDIIKPWSLANGVTEQLG